MDELAVHTKDGDVRTSSEAAGQPETAAEVPEALVVPRLPDELISIILAFVGPRVLHACAAANKRFMSLAEEEFRSRCEARCV